MARVVTIGVKYLTTVRGIRRTERLFVTESDVRAARGDLKTARNE